MKSTFLIIFSFLYHFSNSGSFNNSHVTFENANNITTAMPTANITTQNPTTNITTKNPITNTTTENPITNTTTENPITNITTQNPLTNITTENSTINITTLVPTTQNNSTLSIVCYNQEDIFEDLNPEIVSKKLIDTIRKSKNQIQKTGDSSFINNLKCGLMITKNNTSGDYNFKYGVFDNSECQHSSNDTICHDSSTCNNMAMKCCTGNLEYPCNVYGIEPINKKACKSSNSTQCFQIKEDKEGNPTTPTSSAIGTTSNYADYITSLITLFITKVIKDI